MGMFDSLIDIDGNAWQTKSLSNALDRIEVGQAVPSAAPFRFQVPVIGGPHGRYERAFATISDGALELVPVPADLSLPLLVHQGLWLRPSERPDPDEQWR